MKTCLLLLAAVPCLAFQQASPVASVRRRRQDIITRLPAGATLEEPRTTTTTTELPPVLQDIVNERAEFQRNLGKAMDTLRKDYPEILHTAPGTMNLGDTVNLTFESFHDLSILTDLVFPLHRLFNLPRLHCCNRPFRCAVIRFDCVQECDSVCSNTYVLSLQ